MAGAPPPVPRPGPVGPLWVRLRTMRARDATTELLAGSAVVLSPHPDDETIACGLLAAAKAARGQRVTAVLATDGALGWFGRGPSPPPGQVATTRRAEWHAALDALGVAPDDRHELGFPDGGLGDHHEAAVTVIAGLLGDLAPSQVFLPSPDDLHVDHRALARAVLEAVGSPAGAGGAPALFAYRVYPESGLWPDGDAGGSSGPGAAWRLVRALPRLAVDPDLALRAPAYVPAKAAAVDAYVSQRRLLGGSVREVWRTGVELFRPLRPPAP